MLNIKYGGKYSKNLRIGIMICLDLMDDACRAEMFASEPNLILVPSYNPSPDRFENYRNAIPMDHHVGVAISNVSEHEGKFGKSQIWALIDKLWMEYYDINDCKIAELSGEKVLVFDFYREGILTKVRKSEAYRPMVDPSKVWIIPLTEFISKEADILRGENHRGD